jgi:ABC-2 type transport system permease protein
MHLSLSAPSWRTHLAAILAISRKNWRTFWRYPLNAASWMLQPLIFLTPVYFMSKVFSVDGQAVGFAGYSGTTDYMSFVLIGTALSSFVESVFWVMGYSLKSDMDAGVLESNWLMPVPRLSLLIGHSLNGLATTAVTASSMLIVGALLFGFHPTGNVLAALLTILPMLVGLYGFGFAFAALVLVLREANTLVDMSSFLVQIFSGVNFPVLALPRWLLPVALAMPLTYGYDAVRGLLLNTRTLLPLGVEVLVLVVFMVVMLFVGGVVFNSLERRVRRLGTLGQH